ncbi:DUF302 domain-containing protein [Thioalkalivibrio sp. ALM2T]|uniref:DUF302 domain-containing protein n=1 Tax=Thioalkalivibrio sp. ALM2T TaxID=1158184 RepID=UPI0003665B68|nr:DUF302 domain-containing protein [Thioalkalivibrio sp. ALM2T]
MRYVLYSLSLLLLLGWPLASAHAEAPEHEHFIVKSTEQSREAVLEAIRDYTEASGDWFYLTDIPLRRGALILVKICYIPAAGDIFAAGPHVSALLPCGHLSLYEEDGRTQLSMLHPRFMSTLSPGPEMDRAVEKATPAFEALLDAVLE